MNTGPNTAIRLAIPVTANRGLESRVSPHFGKAPGFILVDSDGRDLDHLATADSSPTHGCAPIEALADREACAG